MWQKWVSPQQLPQFLKPVKAHSPLEKWRITTEQGHWKCGQNSETDLSKNAVKNFSEVGNIFLIPRGIYISQQCPSIQSTTCSSAARVNTVLLSEHTSIEKLTGSKKYLFYCCGMQKNKITPSKGALELLLASLGFAWQCRDSQRHSLAFPFLPPCTVPWRADPRCLPCVCPMEGQWGHGTANTPWAPQGSLRLSKSHCWPLPAPSLQDTKN